MRSRGRAPCLWRPSGGIRDKKKQPVRYRINDGPKRRRRQHALRNSWDMHPTRYGRGSRLYFLLSQGRMTVCVRRRRPEWPSSAGFESAAVRGLRPRRAVCGVPLRICSVPLSGFPRSTCGRPYGGAEFRRRMTQNSGWRPCDRRRLAGTRRSL